jgi:hypothetical protein
MIFNTRYSIGIYERFNKVQKGVTNLNILNSKSRLKLDSYGELKIAE